MPLHTAGPAGRAERDTCRPFALSPEAVPWTPAVEDVRLFITDWELFDFLLLLANQFVQQIVAVAPAGGVSPSVGASERDRIELCLVAMLANAGCLDVTMDNLAKAGVTAIPLIHCMADSQAKFCAFVENACHPGDNAADMAEVAKHISVYVVSESTTLVE